MDETNEDTDTICPDNDTHQSTIMEPLEGPCGNMDCDIMTIRRCSYCSGPRYCSERCEKADHYSHKFSCSHVTITSADHLQRDCFQDVIPQDPQVREDYGFTRCKNRIEESHLFGLYIGLLKYLDIPAEDLHSWRVSGILMGKIIETYSSLPESNRGSYYPWLLRNRHVLDESHTQVREEDNVDLYIQKMVDDARPYLDPSDSNVPARKLTPYAKQNCFRFLAMLLKGMRPPPKMLNMDLWYDFGFVVCCSEDEESSLANVYISLLLANTAARDYFASLGSTQSMPPDYPTCSFADFWKAWEAGTLMDLLDTYGTHGGRDSYGQFLDSVFPDLREFLSYPGTPGPKFPRPSIWRLRHFLALDGANVLTVEPAIAGAAIEYGFHPGLDTRTRLDLHDFYTTIFKQGVYTTKVDEALRRGRLHEVADRWYGGVVDDRVKNVLRTISDAGRTLSEGLDGPWDNENDIYKMWRTPRTYETEEEPEQDDEEETDNDNNEEGSQEEDDDSRGEVDADTAERIASESYCQRPKHKTYSIFTVQ
jgi:hypothetical protein